MSTFSGNEKWRNHPLLRPKLKHFFPGFTWALGAVVIVSVAEHFMPPSAPHGAHHAAGEAGPQTKAAKQTGDGAHGVH